MHPIATRMQKTLIWLIGISLCLITGYWTFKLEISHEENNFESQTNLVYDELTRRYSTLEAVLTALAGFHQASDNVSDVAIIGFPVAIALFIFCYLFWQSHEKWWTAALTAAVLVVLLYLFFDSVLHVVWPEGMLGIG